MSKYIFLAQGVDLLEDEVKEFDKSYIFHVTINEILIAQV